jgi:hypothetical protein
MATTVLKSNQVTFVDTTDSRKLEVYIASNLPTVQIYNVNNKTYSPDWSAGDKLRLTASIFLDSRAIATNDIEWYRQSETQPFATGVSVVTISSNEMSSDAIMTYSCKAKYQNMEASAQISFARNDTGTNGTSAPPVMARYSADGKTNWESKFNSTTHKYIQYSYNGGKEWDIAIKIVGDNGTSVNIKGTATSAKPSTNNPSYYMLTYNSTEITGAELGDAYLYDGDLYVCVDVRDGQDDFMNAGRIQGPSGVNGQSSFVHIQYAPINPNNSNMTDNPDDTTVYIGIYVGEEASKPLTSDSYKWSKFVGESAKLLILSSDSQVFRVDKKNIYTPDEIKVSAQRINIPKTISLKWSYNKDNEGWKDLTSVTQLNGVSLDPIMDVITITGTLLEHNSIAIKVSDGTVEDILTIYKAFDGVDGNNGNPASMAFLTNENISFSANANGQVKSTTFETSVVAYTGTTKVAPIIGTPTGLPTGITLNSSTTSSDEVVLKFSIADNSTLGATSSTNGTIIIPITSPVNTELKFSWSKINSGAKGADGVGINSTQVKYGTTEFVSIKPADDKWSDTIPAVPDGHYLWTRTIIDYTDPNKTDTVTYTYAKQGKDGDKGEDGSSVTVHSIQYQEGTSATSAPTGTWSDYVVPVAEGRYLWTKTTFSDGKIAYGVAKQGQKGDKGDQGVQGPKGDDGQQLYTWVKYADSPTSGMSNDPSGKTYIGLAYNKTTATESGTYSDYMWSLIKGEAGAVGPKGDDGQQYYTWIKYADNASGANMSDSPTGKLYIGLAYNKTTSTESSTASDYTWALFKGDKGDKGDDAYTVLLTNESHVFAGSISAAIASSATTQVLAYNGATSQSVTIVSVNGVTASTASTATGIAGLSFKCSALSGTSPTITFTCTTSFVSPNGTIPIVIKVGSISITKMFTYSIAFKGATGGQGNQGNPGNPATAYWLVSNASVIQKNAAGTVVLTPSTLTFTGKSQTGTSTPVDYGCRWIIAYSTDGSTYTNAYTSTANETTKTFTVDSTYKTIRVRMYLAGGTTTLLDEQIIPVVTDGAIGAPGAPAVTFQIYSSNGYALSINTPTVTLQTFAYIGDVAITASATYQWYIYNNAGWTALSGATNSYLTITRDDVAFSKSYMCKMTFDGVEYTSVATIDDKNDENKVFTTKPSNYVAGDIWIVGVDYVPSGVEIGTLLKAEHTSSTYEDADWITASKYDDKIKEIQSNIDMYNQYFSFNSTEGLKISAKDSNGTPSQFSTSLTNERLSFNYGNEAVAYIDGKKMNIKEANIESPLTVTGKYSGSTMLQAPIINIGNFSLVVESNGSLSIVANI